MEISKRSVMMKAKLFTQDGKENGEIELSEEIFNCKINSSLVHLVVKSLLANKRQGTAKTKGRSEVSGGGRKPYRQKGTGRARAGSNTSPVWVRGGKAFGAIPRSYRTSIPKKMRRAALFSSFTSLAQDGKIFFLQDLNLDKPKTKTINDLLKELSLIGKKNLFIINKDERNLYLSGRNIRNMNIKSVSDINAYDVLHCDNLIFSSVELLDKIEKGNKSE